MKLLVLGGTRFLGRHVVTAAAARGDRVTVFHRGRHTADLPAGVEVVRGDRRDGLGELAGRTWDAVIDTSGYQPGVVGRSTEALRDAAAFYLFVSTISVFEDYSRPGLDESGPVGEIGDAEAAEAEALDPSDPVTARGLGEKYGPLKARCERVVLAAFPGRAAVVRPGLIVGRWDHTDRFGYWVRRVAAGGEVLAPGRPERVVQLIDARDLTEWMLRLAAERHAGVYNATGPASPLRMVEVLETCRAVAGGDATFTWVDDAFLGESGIAPWGELPLWIPEAAEYAGFMRIDCRRARDAGLAFRPLADTVRDALAWERSRGEVATRQAGLDPAKEREVLAAWKVRGVA